jgi:hypothetical protein
MIIWISWGQKKPTSEEVGKTAELVREVTPATALGEGAGCSWLLGGYCSRRLKELPGLLPLKYTVILAKRQKNQVRM